jgi:N-acetylglucosaminyldiphosphoundecaprenol N-acetyl-beta-D-mannosaminyltransferase
MIAIVLSLSVRRPSMDSSNAILGVPIWSEGLEALVSQSVEAIETANRGNGKPYVFACANPHSLAVAERDIEFKSALCSADAVVADGVGVQVAATLAGRSLGPRITGSDYFSAMMTELNARRGRVGFFGSKPEVLDPLISRVRAKFPSVEVVSVISPPFGEWDEDVDQRFVGEIAASSLDMLWVGMTAPKQEKWVQRNVEALGAGAVGSIGAVFDYFAGTVKRAPRWVCQAGLEWAYRFAKEPGRLWERNFVSAPKFIGLAMGEAIALRVGRKG